MLFQTICETPIGALRLVATDDALVRVCFPLHRQTSRIEGRRADGHDVLVCARRELEQYFRGERRTFLTPLAARATDFERAVWDALPTVPFGETRSYAQIAHMLGLPSASRQIGAANAKNPLCIFVPCHRIIAASGALAGYAGGTENKRWLLMHEAFER